MVVRSVCWELPAKTKITTNWIFSGKSHACNTPTKVSLGKLNKFVYTFWRVFWRKLALFWPIRGHLLLLPKLGAHWVENSAMPTTTKKSSADVTLPRSEQQQQRRPPAEEFYAVKMVPSKKAELSLPRRNTVQRKQLQNLPSNDAQLLLFLGWVVANWAQFCARPPPAAKKELFFLLFGPSESRESCCWFPRFDEFLRWWTTRILTGPLKRNKYMQRRWFRVSLEKYLATFFVFSILESFFGGDLYQQYEEHCWISHYFERINKLIGKIYWELFIADMAWALKSL